MFNIIILFTFLLIVSSIYKYYNKQFEAFMEIMGECFDNMNGHVVNENIYHDYSMWKKED